MTTKLSPQAEAVLWACEGNWMSGPMILRAVQTPYAAINHNIPGWPNSVQGIHQSAAALVRKGLLRKDRNGGIVYYRKV